MLKFIKNCLNIKKEMKNFNTSHVKVYLCCFYNRLIQNYNFNTSHVKVYPHPDILMRMNFIISIHLMLKFILYPYWRLMVLQNFNTSHVKVYQEEDGHMYLRYHYFNTSHVKVYH